MMVVATSFRRRCYQHKPVAGCSQAWARVGENDERLTAVMNENQLGFYIHSKTSHYFAVLCIFCMYTVTARVVVIPYLRGTVDGKAKI